MPRFQRLLPSALLGSLALLFLAACVPTTTAQVSVAATASPTLTPTAAPSPTPVPDWREITDPKFGFKVDVPGALWIDPNFNPPRQTNTDSTTWFVYHDTGNGQTSQLASLFYPNGGIELYASTAPHTCTLSGTTVLVGRSITGYRHDSFTDPLVTSGATVPGGRVTFVTGGLYFEIFVAANGQQNQSQYWTDFEPAWKHILASFVPGPAVPDGHPCG